MKTIDLRSDTVTTPTPAMRDAMAQAPVGDDVYGEDPSVNQLQEAAARMLGVEAALFVPSGTMANQAALSTHVARGDVVLAGEGAHILFYESGAPWALWGANVKPIGTRGFFEADDVRKAVATAESHYAQTRAVAFENTHNRGGGTIFPLEQLESAASTARELGLGLHLDGARLWNAVVATGIPASRWASPFDTVSFCLSKGLGAPVGSLVCGSSQRIARVHRARKLLGGGMRQAGILAAAGLYALEHHIERLAEDHENARRLAAGLTQLGFPVEPLPETNMVFFGVKDADGFANATRERGVLVSPFLQGFFRAVLHLDVSSADVDDALGRIEDVSRTGVR